MKLAKFALGFAFLSCALASVSAVSAATITTVFTEQFDDATIDPLLTSNGAPVISNGFADLPGTNGNGLADGFFMDITPYNSADGGAGPEGGGPTTSWIMEAVIGPDGVTGSDGMGATAPSSNDVLFSFNGRYGLRFATATNWSIFNRPAGGASDLNSGIPNAADRPSAGSHIALVFTNNGATDVLAYYKNGVLAHSVTGDLNRSNIQRAGFGLEINSGAALSRGFNGTFDGIAFSTFTGAFDVSQGDQFALPIPVPEPATAFIALLGFAALFGGRLKQKSA